MRRMVVYLAHPVGGGPDRDANLARVRRWLRWAIETCPFAFAVPWLPYCEVLGEEHRDRGVADDVAMLMRCDAVWLVGDRISPGMAIERAVAEACGLPVYDMTRSGGEPPEMAAPTRGGN